MQFLVPLAFEKFLNGVTTLEKFSAVASFGVWRICQSDNFGITGVPCILGSLDFDTSGFFRKWWFQHRIRHIDHSYVEKLLERQI